MKYLLLVYLFVFSTLVISCSSAGSKSEGDHDGGMRNMKGRVIPDIACQGDSSVKYALYLPSGYSTDKRFPVILAFDPHASGNLPVKKYDSLAEQYSCILIGSNNSKNGLPMNETEKIVNTMLSEILSRYSVDSSRIYLMGFSGGARIASLVALYRGGIKGVIGCGAGFPAITQPGKFRFDYIGFAGNGDFNMNELVSLDEQLEKAGFRHALVLFDGKHEWPPAQIMEYAFLWNEFCEMKDGRMEVNKVRIADFTALADQSLKQAEEQKNLYQKKLALDQIIRFLKGIETVDQEKKELNQLLSSQGYKNQVEKINRIRDKERQEQQMFTENFFLKDLKWWKGRITDYTCLPVRQGLRITNEKDREEILMHKRIMSYLSLLAYMNYTNAGSIGDKAKADFALEVYRIVDPENAAKIK